MQKILFLLCSISFFGYSQNIDKKLKTGDILFIENNNGQGAAIQLATKSKWTHVGIVFIENGIPMVYHAVNPVMKSTIKEFLNYSSNKKYVAKRLNKEKTNLNQKQNNEMLIEARQILNKPYDKYFNWGDDEYYCSEYVWKLFKHNYKIEVGSLKELKSFELTSPNVKTLMKKRYGDNIPLSEMMISPADMFNSDLLLDVK